MFAGRTDQHLEDRFASGHSTTLSTGSPMLVEAVACGPEAETLAYVHRKYRVF
ncbi:MAG: hypothetical protein WDN46_25400 [Methylocella sp.]